MVVIENIVDDIARAVGKDPLEIRKANFYSDQGNRNTTHYGQRIKQHIVPGLVERLEQRADYQQRRRDIVAFNRSSSILKKGIALTPVKFGISFTVQHQSGRGAHPRLYGWQYPAQPWWHGNGPGSVHQGCPDCCA